MALHYLGELGFRGILYLTRNCMLEPVTNNTTAEQCIFKIATLFEKGFPAILSSHRINYTSRVSAEARDKGLAVLDSVLKKVKEMFSEVEFLSSDKLAERILAEKQTGNPG